MQMKNVKKRKGTWRHLGDTRACLCKPYLLFGGLLVAMMFVTLPASAERLAREANVAEAQSTQQNQTVTGIVVDEFGEAMIGVSILVERSTTGTITDFEGRFSLKAPANATLIVSYIGYQTKRVKVASQRDLHIALSPDQKLLDEVVVVGYGTVKKRDLTGAVSSVKSDIIKLTPAINPMEALQGRVAGLDIIRDSGEAGTGTTMQLRGNRSITASGTPLVIIDGMPGDYETLNPNDIESIDILKDASSTAVYGSEGSNGVIIITTKKGEVGKLRVNFDAYLGYNGWSTLPKMTSPEQIVYTSYLARQEAGVMGDDDDWQTRVNEEALERGEIIDWVDALMDDGWIQNYSLSFSGGTEKTQAYFSLNVSDEKGQYHNDDYKVYSSTIRINHKVNKWFSGGLHAQLSYKDRERTYSKLDKALRASPFGTLYKEDGTLNEYPVTGDNTQVNLLLNQDRSVYRNNPSSMNVYVQPYIRITPIKGLTLESRLSTKWSYSTTNEYIGYGSYQFYDAAGTGAVNETDKTKLADYTSASIENSRNKSYTWENILTYNFKLGDYHEFTLTGVTSWSDSETEKSKSEAVGITSNTYYWTNLEAATGTKSVESSYSMQKRMGYVGRLNYSYLGRYLFSASIRYDGDSRLAKDVRWDTFPAFSAGWRISDERFMESTRGWLNNLKIRVGYGETGGAGIDAYDSWSILSQGIIGLGSEQITSYSYPQNLSNAALTWERSKNTNIGIDASFLDNRIELTADYYVTNTEGVIWEQNLPITSGGYTASEYFTINRNIAETRNKGLELTLTGRPVMTRDFNWTSTLTYFKNSEKVTSLGEGAAEFITNGDYTLSVGSPIHSYRAFDIVGVWQYGEEDDAAAFGKKPGDLKVNVPNMRKVSDGVWEKTYEQEDGTWATNTYDTENPYAVSADDKTMIGHNSPDWSLGFQNTFTWKDFDLSIYMYLRHGQMIYYDPITWYSSSGGSSWPAHFNYWTSTNPSNDFPALDSSRNWKDDEYYTSLAYVDGSFFKIKNITLGYTMPKRLCSKIGLASLRVYGTITNPYVKAFNHLLKDYDPEMGGDLDFPLTKQLVLGLSLSF